MKAIGYKTPGTLDRNDALVDIEIERPTATGRDLLVKVDAISVNPVDTKVRGSARPNDGQWKILGWDAVGRVAAIGDAVIGFEVGDLVYYAGEITRPGANSEFHLVDERIVARKPASLTTAEAAALPLTAITAYEMLFDRLKIGLPVPGAANAIVIVGGAGGVGSIAIQLVRALTDLTVIATASRPITRKWVTALGAHHVLDHSLPLAEQVAALGLGSPGFVFSTTATHRHLDEIVKLLAPQGRLGLIDDPDTLDVVGLKSKAISLHWESMFARSMFQTPDIGEQGRLLAEVAGLIDQGKIRTTATETLYPINAANLLQAHALVETGKVMGKIVLRGF